MNSHEMARELATAMRTSYSPAVEPVWARSYHFGAGRLPAFLANPVSDG